MSGHVVIPFRTLSKNNREMLGIQYTACEATFSSASGDKMELPLEIGGSSVENYYIVGLDKEWNPDTCKCTFKQTLLLNSITTRALFHGEESITDKKSVLGIAAVWSVSRSNITGCEILPVDLTYDSLSSRAEGGISVPLELSFEPGALSGKLTVQYQLFLKRPDKSRHINGMAVVPGTILGELTEPLEIEIDGDGSFFPIVTVEQNDMPLWWIDSSNMEDPLVDPMDQDYFCFVINAKHDDYAKLYAKKGQEFDTPLYREIFSAGLEEMFRRLYLSKDYISDKMKEAEQGEEGSIALCFDYMRKSLNIDVDTSEKLHNSVRKAVAKQLKGAAS